MRAQGVDDEAIKAEVCEETRVSKKIHDPALPSRVERGLCGLTHVQFRWGEGSKHEKSAEMPGQTEIHAEFFSGG